MSAPEVAYNTMEARPEGLKSHLVKSPKLSRLLAKNLWMTCTIGLQKEQHLSSNEDPVFKFQTYRPLKRQPKESEKLEGSQKCQHGYSSFETVSLDR